MSIKILFGFIFSSLILTGCSSSSDSAPPSSGAPIPTGTPIQGLADCTAQTNRAVICGKTTASDGVTPLIGAEIKLITTGNAKPLVSKGIADTSKCITDTNGEFACLLPEGTSGTYQFVVSNSGFSNASFSAALIVGSTTDIGATTLTANNSQKWVVVPGSFDGVQILLAQLKGCTLNNSSDMPFDPTMDNHSDARSSTDCTNKGLLVLDYADVDSSLNINTFLASQSLHDYDALFINCGAYNYYENFSAINSNIKQFVAADKSLYFSDLTDAWLTELYPDNINFLGNDTSIGEIIGNVVHTGLAGAVGNPISIVFDLGFWSAMESVTSNVNTFITGDITSVSNYTGTYPITVGWKNTINSGCIFYTSYHIEGASDGAPQELAMKYLIQNLQQVCI